MEIMFGLVFGLYLVSGSLGVSVKTSQRILDIEENSPVTLGCEIQTSCSDKPQITWFKGKPGVGPIVLKVNTAGNVYISPNYTNHVRLDGQANLVIISPELSDSGNYSCEALITVDVPPIDAQYIYVKVIAKRIATTSVDAVSLGVAIVDTFAILVGILQFFFWEKSNFQELRQRLATLHASLCWMGLCLVGATLLWTEFTLSLKTLHIGCISTTGVILSAVGLVLAVLCYMYRVLAWIRKRKGHREKGDKKNKTSTPMLNQSPSKVHPLEPRVLVMS